MSYRPLAVFPEKRRFSPDLEFKGQGVSFFYTYIRKNASTSFKKLFQAIYPEVCTGELPSIRCMVEHAQVKDLTPEEIDKTYSTKVFVYRDPIERVFSVYKNKLIQMQGADDLLKKLKLSIKRDPGLLTFNEFVTEYVSLLETNRWQEVDGHLYPQAWHLLPITYDKVISMDALHHEMRDILPEELCDEVFSEPVNSTTEDGVQLTLCDADCPAVYFQKKYAECKALPSLDQVLDPGVKKRLQEIYAEDYLMLERSGVVGSAQFKKESRLVDPLGFFVGAFESSVHRYREVCQTIKKIQDDFAAKNTECQELAKQLIDKEQAYCVLNDEFTELSDIKIEYEVVTKQIKDLESQLLSFQQNAKRDEEAATKQIEDLESQLLSFQQNAKRDEDVVSRLTQKLEQSEHDLIKIKSSARYQAGSHLVAAGKSWKGVVRLPLALWRVVKHKRKRRIQKKAVNTSVKKQSVTKGQGSASVAPRIQAAGINAAPLTAPSAQEVGKKIPSFIAPSAQTAEISILGWPDYPANDKPYVIGIMDEFTAGCFEQDVNLIQPRPDNWYALAEKYKPEFFFIESAWKGNFGVWQYRVADYSNKPGDEVAHICQYAREKGIPTVFWNKEDPVHHEKFMCSASRLLIFSSPRTH